MGIDAEPLAHATTRIETSQTRYLILAMILLLATVAYADRSILSIAAPGIQDEFGLSAIHLGYVLSAFSWAYVLGQLPGGMLLDRFGSKTVYGVSLVLWSAATLAIGFIGHITSDLSMAIGPLFLLRFVLGLVEAPSFPANGRIVSMWFPSQERGLATSLFASASYFAVAVFSPLAGWLVHSWGWEGPFIVLGVLGLLCSFLWIRFMHPPRQHSRVSAAELNHMIEGGAMVDIDNQQTLKDRPGFSWPILKQLLTNRMLWCAYIGQYCAIALSYFFITWFPIYLVQGRGMDVMHAGISTVIPAIAGFLGGVGGGALSDLLIRKGWTVSRARKTPYVCGMALGCSLVLAAFTDSNVMVIALMTLAFFGKGLAVGAGTWAVVSDTAPKEAVGLAGAVFNCIGNVGGIMTPIVFGYIVQATGGYSVGLYFVAAHCLVAALVYLFVMGDITRVQVAQK